MILDGDFFHRPVLDVAPSLLGKVLVRKRGEDLQEAVITEVEAYDGTQDLACHACRGRTKRTALLFGAPGLWYVYFVYGMHWMLNIVCREEGYPAAVLIRGAGDWDGPGKLTRGLRITGSFNGKVSGKESGLWIEDTGIDVPDKSILRTPRIGVQYAKEWAEKPYRFVWVNERAAGREKPSELSQRRQRSQRR